MVERLVKTNTRANLVLIACGILFFLSFTAAGFALIERFHQTNDKRNAQARVVVQLLCFVQTYSVSQPNTRPENVARIRQFTQGALTSIGADPDSCSHG